MCTTNPSWHMLSPVPTNLAMGHHLAWRHPTTVNTDGTCSSQQPCRDHGAWMMDDGWWLWIILGGVTVVVLFPANSAFNFWASQRWASNETSSPAISPDFAFVQMLPFMWLYAISDDLLHVSTPRWNPRAPWKGITTYQICRIPRNPAPTS